MTKIVEIDAVSGEIIEREPDKTEEAQLAIDRARYDARIVQLKEKGNSKNAILKKLGITENEWQLLFQ